MMEARTMIPKNKSKVRNRNIDGEKDGSRSRRSRKGNPDYMDMGADSSDVETNSEIQELTAMTSASRSSLESQHQNQNQNLNQHLEEHRNRFVVAAVEASLGTIQRLNARNLISTLRSSSLSSASPRSRPASGSRSRSRSRSTSPPVPVPVAIVGGGVAGALPVSSASVLVTGGGETVEDRLQSKIPSESNTSVSRHSPEAKCTSSANSTSNSAPKFPNRNPRISNNKTPSKPCGDGDESNGNEEDDQSNYDSSKLPLDYSAKRVKLEGLAKHSTINNNNNINGFVHQYQRTLSSQDLNQNQNPDQNQNQDQNHKSRSQRKSKPKIVTNTSPSPSTSPRSQRDKESRLRGYLTKIMKSPVDMVANHGTILNLSKPHSPTAARYPGMGAGVGPIINGTSGWVQKSSPPVADHVDLVQIQSQRSGSACSTGGSRSLSSSPGMNEYESQMHHLRIQHQHQLMLQQQLQIQPGTNNFMSGPRSAPSQLNGTSPIHMNGGGFPGLNQANGIPQTDLSAPNSHVNPLNYGHYAMLFGSGLSPVSHTMSNGTTIPISLNTSPTLFSNPFSTSAPSQIPGVPNGLSTTVNPKAIRNGVQPAKGPPRPFKAYPKDPMSLSAAGGIYGLTTPLGLTDSNIHQHSQLEYASFRAMMLSNTQATKTKRGGQRNVNGAPPVSDSLITSPSQDHFNHNQGVENSYGEENSHSGAEDDCNGAGSGSGCGSGDSRGIKRKAPSSIKPDDKSGDPVYRERRRKNNEAAKRSRDARRAKEDEIAIRAAYLEQENVKLRFEMTVMQNEISRLRLMILGNNTIPPTS